jgi:hypothetical protein
VDGSFLLFSERVEAVETVGVFRIGVINAFADFDWEQIINNKVARFGALWINPLVYY